MNLIASILGPIITTGVTLAERIFPGHGTGPMKHDWVVGFAKNAVQDLDKILPAWSKPAEDLMQQLISVGIESALNALKL